MDRVLTQSAVSSRSSAIWRRLSTVSARSVASSLLQPPVELGQDLLGVAAGRADQEDPVEPLLVRRVAGRQPRGGVAGRRVDAGLLRWRLRPAALADPRVTGQRLVELLVGELAGGPVGGGEQRVAVGVRLAGQHVVGPARHRQAAQQDLAGGLRAVCGHQQNPGTCSHASPAGGASSRVTCASIRP